MSFQLLLGKSGSGKSYRLYKEIIDKSIQNEDSNYIIIVPEQFTMQTQKDIVAKHERNGTMNIDILSFMRLAYRIFTEVGIHNKTILDDTGKSMLLKRVLEKKKDDLVFFNSGNNKIGFISELKSIISEFYQYSISEEQLNKLLEATGDKPILNEKIKDIITVLDGFKEMMEDEYITAEEVLSILKNIIRESAIIKKSVICLDGFTGFTPSQYELLEELMIYAQKVIVTVTVDQEEDVYNPGKEYELFHLSRRTIDSLVKIARKASVTIDEAIIINDNVPYRYKDNEPLAYLEKNIFRYPYRIYNKEQNKVSVHSALNPEMEVKFVAREINILIKELGLRYKDIAIVTGDIEGYASIIQRIFDERNIPVFQDNKKTMLSNPFAELIRSALEIINENFTYESVFRYLRCGLSNIKREDIDMLENYVLAFGIRGHKKWNEQWIKKNKRLPIDLEQINIIREEVVSNLLPFRTIMINKDSSVRDYTKGLYEFITELNIQGKLEEYSRKFNNDNERLLEKEYKQIYKIVMELLDKLVSLLGDTQMSSKEYEQILLVGLEEAKIGIIPPGIDQIVIGDIERTRLKDIKVLFLIGANEGIIPKSNSGGGILSEFDRQLFVDNRIELAPNKRQSSYILQFYLYLNLTKPSDRLYLSFSKLNNEGKSIRPSFLIGKIIQLFEKLTIIDEEEKEKDIELIRTSKDGLYYITDRIKDNNDIKLKELMNWYFSNEEGKEELINIIEGAFYTNQEIGLSKAVATALYGKELQGSVTRLERYVSCAFAHFLQYGMLLKERVEYKLAAPDIGTIVHNSIEIFSKKLQNSNYEWTTITKDIREQLVSESIKEASEDYGSGILTGSARIEYILNRIKRIVNRTVWALCEHIKQGKFIPHSYEVEFSMTDNLEAVNIPLSEDENIKLVGRIDRIDRYEDEDKVYVKVIDYKTGIAAFDMVSLYHGLQMQLIVYLNAALELENNNNANKKVIPAGVFYYNIDDPIVEKADSKDDIEYRILKELRMNGLANNNKEILELLDNKTEGKSDIIPIKYNKDGTLSKDSSVVATEQFHRLNKYVNKKIKAIGRDILDGKTKINPYKKGTKTACDYCEYSGVCGFDLKIQGNTFRKLKIFDTEEIWERIKG